MIVTCERCGKSAEVAEEIRGKSAVEWWESRGRKCKNCQGVTVEDLIRVFNADIIEEIDRREKT